jgi:hypothetical protein
MMAPVKLKNILILAALSFAPACSKSGDPAEKMVTMMEEMGDAISGANGDCSKMASSVEGVFNKYEGDIKEMKAAGDKIKGDKEKTKEMMDKYGDRIQKVMPKMMDMMKCANDPKMKELSKKFEGMM